MIFLDTGRGTCYDFLLLKTKPPLFVIGLCASALAAFSAWADLTSYSLFKTANYHQTSPAQPAAIDAPNAYFCGVQLFTDTNVNEVVSNAAFFDPDSNFYVMDAPSTRIILNTEARSIRTRRAWTRHFRRASTCAWSTWTRIPRFTGIRGNCS